MEEIKKKAIANGTFLKAPNGEKTNLTEEQWLLVRTKGFKKWFGDWERLAELENLLNPKGVEQIPFSDDKYYRVTTISEINSINRTGKLSSPEISMFDMKILKKLHDKTGMSYEELEKLNSTIEGQTRLREIWEENKISPLAPRAKSNHGDIGFQKGNTYYKLDNADEGTVVIATRNGNTKFLQGHHGGYSGRYNDDIKVGEPVVLRDGFDASNFEYWVKREDGWHRFDFDTQNTSAESIKHYLTVAPYFREKLTSKNKEELEKKTAEVKERVINFAKALGLKISIVETNAGVFEGSPEISYTYQVEGGTQEQIDLFAALMGDISNEYQDAVIVSNYVSKDDPSANAIEVTLHKKDATPEQMEADFKELGLEGGTYNYSSGNITFFVSLVKWDENGNPTPKTQEEINAEIDNINKLNSKGYERGQQLYQNSRYLENSSRQETYRSWMERGIKNRMLDNACKKALAICEAAAPYGRKDQEAERIKAAQEAAEQWDRNNLTEDSAPYQKSTTPQSNKSTTPQSNKSTTPQSDTESLQKEYDELKSKVSKVVDKNGEPKVVYHGNPDTNIRVFSPGKGKFSDAPLYYFSDSKDTALSYATRGDSELDPNDFTIKGFNVAEDEEYADFDSIEDFHAKTRASGKVYEVFLNLRDPLDNVKSRYIHDDRLIKNTSHDGMISVPFSDNYDGVADRRSRATQYVVRSSNQIKSATNNNGNFSLYRDEIEQHIIGEKGAAALDKYEEATTRLDNLKVAKEMEAELKPDWNAKRDENALKIKLATGWEKGKDGKWRYEISDIKIKEDFIDKIFNLSLEERRKLSNLKLSDVIEHETLEALTKAYPVLKEIKLKVVNDVFLDIFNSTRGYYKPETKELMLNFEAAVLSKVDSKDIQRTFVHEIQHIIQKEEGFATGGNEHIVENHPKILEQKKKIDDLYDKLEQAKKDAIESSTDKTIKQYNEEKKNLEKNLKAAEETLKKHRESPKKLSNPQRDKKLNEYQKVKEELDELQKSIKSRFSNRVKIKELKEVLNSLNDEINKMPLTIFNPNRLSNEKADDLELEILELQNDINHLDSQIQASVSSPAIDNLNKQIDKEEQHLRDLPYILYRSIAGETESRNTSDRIKKTLEERRQSLLSSTEDVAREDQIIIEEYLNGAQQGLSGMQRSVNKRKPRPSVNSEIDDIKKEDLRRLLKKINKAGRTLLYDGEGTMYLLDHTDKEGIENRNPDIHDGFNCVLMFPAAGLSREDIHKIKEAIEDGIIRDQTSFNKWVKSNIRQQGSDNSDSIDAAERTTNENNDRLDLQTSEGESIGGQSNQNSQVDLGTGFVKVPGNDGSNGPRWIPISNNEKQYFQTPKGQVYGFVDQKGEIYLDENIISIEHPIHEYTHLWDRAVKARNPKLWKHGVNLMKQTKLWNEYLNDENYGKKWQNKGILYDKLICCSFCIRYKRNKKRIPHPERVTPIIHTRG